MAFFYWALIAKYTQKCNNLTLKWTNQLTDKCLSINHLNSTWTSMSVLTHVAQLPPGTLPHLSFIHPVIHSFTLTMNLNFRQGSGEEGRNERKKEKRGRELSFLPLSLRSDLKDLHRSRQPPPKRQLPPPPSSALCFPQSLRYVWQTYTNAWTQIPSPAKACSVWLVFSTPGNPALKAYQLTLTSYASAQLCVQACVHLCGEEVG